MKESIEGAKCLLWNPGCGIVVIQMRHDGDLVQITVVAVDRMRVVRFWVDLKDRADRSCQRIGYTRYKKDRSCE